MQVDTQTGLAKGIGVALATEVCADVAIIGAVKAARGKAPWRYAAVAGGLAAVGVAALVRLIPQIEAAVLSLAAESLEQREYITGKSGDEAGEGACGA